MKEKITARQRLLEIQDEVFDAISNKEGWAMCKIESPIKGNVYNWTIEALNEEETKDYMRELAALRSSNEELKTMPIACILRDGTFIAVSNSYTSEAMDVLKWVLIHAFTKWLMRRIFKDEIVGPMGL